MNKLELQKPVSGDKLVEIVQATVDTLNAANRFGCDFRYELQDGKGYPFQELTPDGDSDIVINCHPPERLFDHSPSFLVAFRGVRSDEQYSSVQYSTQVWGLRTGGIKDIDLDDRRNKEYREITDRVKEGIVKYSGMDELPRQVSQRRKGPTIFY